MLPMTEKIIKTTKYKLILILGQLNPKEWRALKKFVLMYTREKSDNIDLFTILRKEINQLNSNEDVQSLHLEHFPQMTAKTFSNMMSRLTLWVEDWLVYEDIRKSDDRDIRLIRLYNLRGLYKQSNVIAKKAIKTAETKPGMSLIATKNLAQIHYYQYYSNNPIKYQQSQLLDKMILSYMEDYNNMLMLFRNQSIFFKLSLPTYKGIHEKTLDRVIKLLPKNNTSNLLSATGTLISNYDYKSLLTLKEKLEQGKLTPKSDLHIITTMYVYSRTLSLWAKNKFKDPKVLESILNYTLESGVILSSDKISPMEWHTLVSVISTVENHKQAESFIDKWHTKVDSKSISAIRSLSMAQLCFHKEKYDEIRDHIYKMVSIEADNKNRANCLIVISLFKDRNNNYKLFIDFAQNFLRQLSRAKKKMAINTFESYTNLTLTLLSIAKSSFQDSKVMIEDSRNIMYRNWLRNEIKKADTI